MSRFEDDPREVDDSRAGCFLWVMLLLALIVGTVVSEWGDIWEWLRMVWGDFAG